jgi:uncharacterized protein with von Willebrand factor type A (vWA) domain
MTEFLGIDRNALLPTPVTGDDSVPESGGNGGGYLLGHLLRFGQLLRVMGIDVSTRQILDLVEALKYVPISDRTDFYHTCKALLVNRRESFLVFDQAFQLFWLAVRGGAQGQVPTSDAEVKRARLPSVPLTGQDAVPGGEENQGQKPGQGEEDGDQPDRQQMMVYSSDEVLRQKDFGEMTWEEIQAAKRAIISLEWQLGERRTRRVRSGYKGRIDLRRMIRDNLRHGGEPIRLSYRQRVFRPRPLVVLSDISGSMERYSRMLLHFIHALTHGLRDTSVESFVFGTRLTRITRNLRYKDVDESLNELGQVVCDWSGGTRIGEALKVFNFQWARRVLGRGAVVLVISDGWDRGDQELLAREIMRLQRSSFRLIWLNPLLGSDDYQPVQRGMATVMPCVDDFLPVHNLASLEQLAGVLSSVAAIRPVRKQRVCTPEAEGPARDDRPPVDQPPPDKDRDWARRVSNRPDVGPTLRG